MSTDIEQSSIKNLIDETSIGSDSRRYLIYLLLSLFMKVFLENTRRNPSSGMFNFLFYVQIYFKIHFETYTIWDIWKFDARMKILLLPCLDYFVDPRFVRLIELRPCLVSCQSFSRCLGQAKDGKIFISRRSRWNWRKFGKTRNLGSWLY